MKETRAKQRIAVRNSPGLTRFLEHVCDQHKTKKHFELQGRKLLKAFSSSPMTMLEASRLTGIERANICRRISQWEPSNKIFRLNRAKCSISKHWAYLFTTDIKIYKAFLNHDKIDKK